MAIKATAPMTTLITSSIWVLLSAIFLYGSYSRIAHLRSAGQDVSSWQYAQTVFWVVVLLFWIWNGWKSWLRYHTDKG